jgi:hypothetical protein
MIAAFQQEVKSDNYLSGRQGKARKVIPGLWVPPRPLDQNGLESEMIAPRVKMPFLLIFCAFL